MKPVSGLARAAAISCLLSATACARLAVDDEVPEWMFDVYSTLPVTAEGSKGVTRYVFHEDNRVEVEQAQGCGGHLVTWELTWEP